VRRITISTGVVLAAVTIPSLSVAEIIYKEGDKYMEIGGRIQMQYRLDAPDGGENTDELFLRRLRSYVEGSMYKNWSGKIEWDMGRAKDTNELSVKDAYMQYKTTSGIKVILGNEKFPFSREQLTSSKRQQLVERSFVGSSSYGSPSRNLGLHLIGSSSEKMLRWGASIAQANIDPNADKLDFDSPVNKNSDFNEGFIFGGRVEIGFGKKIALSQGDFNRRVWLRIRRDTLC